MPGMESQRLRIQCEPGALRLPRDHRDPAMVQSTALPTGRGHKQSGPSMRRNPQSDGDQ